MIANGKSSIEDYREQARDYLRDYLVILEYQYQAIEADDVDRLEEYIRRGREVLVALEAVQKVVHAWDSGSTSDDVTTRLMNRVRSQHRDNRDLLSARRDEMQVRLKDVHVPLQSRSVFQSAEHGGVMVDLVY